MPRYRRSSYCSVRGFQIQNEDRDSDSSSDSSNISILSASSPPASPFTPSPVVSVPSSPDSGARPRRLAFRSSSSDSDSEVEVAEVPASQVINDDSDNSSDSSVDLNVDIVSPLVNNRDQGDLDANNLSLSPISSADSNHSNRSGDSERLFHWSDNSDADSNIPPAPQPFGLPPSPNFFNFLAAIDHESLSPASSTTDDSSVGVGSGSNDTDTDFSNESDSNIFNIPAPRARRRFNLSSASNEHSELGSQSDISVAGSSNSSGSRNSTSRAVREFFRSISQGQESESVERAPVSMNNTAMTGPRRDALSFECSVCLEALDGPASIDLNALGEEEPGPGMQQLIHQLADAVGLFSANIGRGGGAGTAGRQTASRGRRSGASNARSRQRGPNVNDENASLTDVVATHCGHLYHQVCLIKWFTQQGRRTCPSCRKNFPATKLIRLYPSCTAAPASAGSGNQPAPSAPVPTTSANASGNGPSTSASASAPTPASTGGAPYSGAGCAECRDLRDIHNTLINDYTSLQERYNTIREDEDMKNAQISSLEEENARNVAEIAQLRSELEEIRGNRPRTRARTRTPPTQAGSKRRRR